MIDFIKYELFGVDPKHLESNDKLIFHNKVDIQTGELGSYINATYKGLEFKIYEITEKTKYRRITVEGSLHKYWNSGAHNFNDFGINEIREVLKELKYYFNILPKNCVIRQLEIGVNIFPPVNTKSLLNCCLMHKTDRLKWIFTKDEGNYIQAEYQRHIFKLYDKKTHYLNKGFTITENNILRIEIKHTKMYYLKSKGINTLEDLLNYGLHNFSSDLVEHWNSILFFDKSTFKGTKEEPLYSNPNYWENLLNDDYEKFKYERKKLNNSTLLNPNNLKSKIARLVKLKCKHLNEEIPEINPLHIRLKTGKRTSAYCDPNRQFCQITDLNISMQKESIFLSHTGLKYYHKTDKKIFEEVKRKYLSINWKDADHKKQIKEIAHNIRNKANNLRLKQERLYPSVQRTLFEITA
ncbi:MAG: hypothetical protein ABGW97_07255 [Christiangramia sp.]|uniref:hypothetical protein n=1 Tax=Christiangramia sp. TaxID=1931228 RepID=UPI0032429B7C